MVLLGLLGTSWSGLSQTTEPSPAPAPTSSSSSSSLPPGSSGGDVFRGVRETFKELNAAVGGWDQVLGVPGVSLLKRNASVSKHIVLPMAGDLPPQAASEAEEDLLVLGRILEKSISGLELTDAGKSVGSILRPLGNSLANRHLHLEGYGAIFSYQLTIPVVPSGIATAQASNAPVSSAWAEARREVYGSSARDVRPVANRPATSNAEDDAVRFAMVRTNLVEALKNVTFMRQLKTNETVTVLLQGRDGSVLQGTRRTAEHLIGQILPVNSDPNASAPATFCLRIRKGDADALAGGKIDLAEFRKRIKEVIY